jgi:hypothetical protein
LLAIVPLVGKFSGFDAAIAFPGDVDGESRVLEAVADSIGNDSIADAFAPVVERQLVYPNLRVATGTCRRIRDFDDGMDVVVGFFSQTIRKAESNDHRGANHNHRPAWQRHDE